MVLFFFGLPNDLPWLIGSAVAAGFFVIALLPVSFECAVEITYPVNESTSAGLSPLFVLSCAVLIWMRVKDCW